MNNLKRLKLDTKKESGKEQQSSTSRIITIILLMVIISLIVYEVALKPDSLGSNYIPEDFTNPFVKTVGKSTFLPEDTIKVTDLDTIVWKDNPIELAKIFKIETFMNGNPTRVRINHVLYASGNFLNEKFKIVKINPPLVILSDEKGGLHRLVYRGEWETACKIFNWKDKDLYKNEEVIKPITDSNFKKETSEFFGPFRITNASKSQLESMHKWIDENPEYTEDEFKAELNNRGLKFKPALNSAYGGKLKFDE